MVSLQDIKKHYGLSFRHAFYSKCCLCNKTEYGELVGCKFFGYVCLFPSREAPDLLGRLPKHYFDDSKVCKKKYKAVERIKKNEEEGYG